MKQDMKALEGAWTVVSLEIDGRTMEAGSARLVVKDGRFTTESMGAVYEGIVKIDPAQAPKHFDLEFTAGPEKGNTNRGIYELDGDRWRICLNTTGGERPREFATRAGSGLALETLQRAAARPLSGKRPKGEATAAIASPLIPPEGDPASELAGAWDMHSMVFSGKPLETEYLAYGLREATGAQVKVTMARQVMLEAAYRVDRSKQPHQMNYILTRGPHKGKSQPGIYRLTGETLETCFAAPGGERPTEFDSTAGDGRTYTVWKRRARS